MQIHENRHLGHDGWIALAGHDFDATRRCFAEGLRLLNGAAYRCTHGQMLSRDDMARVFAAYGGHDWKRSSESAAFRSRSSPAIRSSRRTGFLAELRIAS